MKPPRAQLDLIRAVSAWAPPVHFFGGFAEDALLHGHASREHDDVDVLVMRDELDLRIEQARAIGFDEWHVRLAAVPGRPLVVGSWTGDLLLEFSVFDRAPDGRVYWEKPTQDGLSRLYLPAGAFDAPTSRIHGVEMRTLSPLALYHIRAGVEDLFGGMRPKDAVSQAALKHAFFAEVPEAQLAPEVEPITGPLARARAAPPRARK